MKKCISFLLIVMIAILGNSVFVSAAAPTLDLLDTFDELDVGPITAADVGAYSNAFDNCSYFRPNGAEIYITDDGFKGNAVTFVEDGGTGCYIDMRNGNTNTSFAPTQDEPVYLSFKMKVVNSLGNTERFHIKTGNGSTLMLAQNNGGSYLWWHAGDVQRFNCVEGEWVSVLIKMSVGKTEISVSDMYGHTNTSSRAETAAFIRVTNADGQAGSSFALDEIRILQGADLSEEPEISLADGSEQLTENVSRIPEFNFLYAPFMSVDANALDVSVTDENGVLINSDMYTVDAMFETINIKFTELLEKNSKYTITLSGVKDGDGVEVAPYEHTFTTELVHKLTLADKNITDEAVELTFDGTMGYPSTDVVVMSVIYEDTMVSYMDYRAAVIDADGKLILSEYELPEGKELDDLTVLVFSDSQKHIPICKAINCFE